MEKSEPTLVPEWLKSTGNISVGGSTSHHSASSSSLSDDHTGTSSSRNRSSFSVGGDYDSPRSSAFSDRTSSHYFHRSTSSNGSAGHGRDPSSFSRAYNSFSRSHRERDWDKDLLDYHDKDRSFLGNRSRDYFDSLGSRIEKDTLRRSQSMVSGKRGEVWPKKVTAVSNNSKNNNHNTNNGVNVGGTTVINNIHKATFERDFPSLGAEERQGIPEIGRVSSPGLGTSVQCLTMGTSAVLTDGWTSALVEVPPMLGSNNSVLASAQQSAPASLTTSAHTTTVSRNMAETLAQAPPRARTVPQMSVETQRLEEFALKQSKQLIPVTPSMPKALVLNSEKQKPKAAARSGEMTMANKVGQQQQLASSHHINPPLQGGVARPDASKTSHGGKLLVLKAAREKNGILLDGSSPTNASRVATNNPLTVAAPTASLTSPNNPKVASSAQRKISPLPFTLASPVEKRLTMSQAQSRNKFFDLMRMKTSANPSSATPDPNQIVSSISPKKSDELLITEVGITPVSSPQGGDDDATPLPDSNGLDWSATENGVDGIASNGNVCQEESHQGYTDNGGDSGEQHPSPDEIVYPDEEEAAFLRSLGWDENAEEGGLTPEEINGFYETVQYNRDLRSSLKLCSGSQHLKLQLILDPHMDSASSESSSRDSKSAKRDVPSF